MARPPNPPSRHVFSRPAGDLLRAAGVVAVYAEIAGRCTDSAFWPTFAAASARAEFWRNLRRNSFRQPDPLRDMLVALKRTQFGAAVHSAVSSARYNPLFPLFP